MCPNGKVGSEGGGGEKEVCRRCHMSVIVSWACLQSAAPQDNLVTPLLGRYAPLM